MLLNLHEMIKDQIIKFNLTYNYWQVLGIVFTFSLAMLEQKILQVIPFTKK